MIEPLSDDNRLRLKMEGAYRAQAEFMCETLVVSSYHEKYAQEALDKFRDQVKEARTALDALKKQKHVYPLDAWDRKLKVLEKAAKAASLY